MAILDIELLGPPRIHVNGQVLRWRGDHQQRRRYTEGEAVLYYCVDARRPVAVQTLYELVWPHQDTSQPKHALSQVLYAFREGLKVSGAPPDFVAHCLVSRPDEGQVEFNVDCDYKYDVYQFEKLTEAVPAKTSLTTLEQARTLYRQPFLETFQPHRRTHRRTIYCDDFEAWIGHRREQLAGVYHNLLDQLSRRYLIRGDWANAIDCLTPLLPRSDTAQEARAEPDLPAPAQDDTVCALLMTSYVCLHQLDRAWRTYISYRQTLQDPPFHCHPGPGLTAFAKLIRGESFSTLCPERLLTAAFDQIGHKALPSGLPEILGQVYSVLKVHRTPPWSAHVHEVFRDAQTEASHHGAYLMGTPHLALALCARAAAAPLPLTSLPVSLATITTAIRHILGAAAPGHQAPHGRSLPLARVVQRAEYLAGHTQAEAVEVPHLWMALLEEQQSVLNDVLARYDIRRDAVLADLEEEMAPEP